MCSDRNTRLASDYRGMLAIQDRPYLSWIVTKGDLPCAEEYLLNIRLRTYAFRMRDGVCTVGAIRRCTVRVTLYPSYPYVAPCVRMLDIPPVFHPDWFSKGSYCPPAPWTPDTSLKDFILTMLDSLRYEPELIGDSSPANFKALDWYQANRGRAELFPSDPTPLSENDPDRIAVLKQSAEVFSEIADRWSVH